MNHIDTNKSSVIFCNWYFGHIQIKSSQSDSCYHPLIFCLHLWFHHPSHRCYAVFPGSLQRWLGLHLQEARRHMHHRCLWHDHVPHVSYITFKSKSNQFKMIPFTTHTHYLFWYLPPSLISSTHRCYAVLKDDWLYIYKKPADTCTTDAYDMTSYVVSANVASIGTLRNFKNQKLSISLEHKVMVLMFFWVFLQLLSVLRK